MNQVTLRLFNADAYPGRPRILFVGHGHSTHVHTWVDLLDGAHFNVRLFALNSPVPPPDWKVKTYLTSSTRGMNPIYRRQAFPPRGIGGLAVRVWNRVVNRFEKRLGVSRLVTPEKSLVNVIRDWRPDIVQTFGLEPYGELFFHLKERYHLEKDYGKWIVQLRGGSDLTLNRLDPQRAGEISRVLSACDSILTDNKVNFDYLEQLGVDISKIASLAPVPGSGGVDVDALAENWAMPPSQRRIILMPKAYDHIYAVTLPVFEALKLAWERIQPCEIHMLYMITESTRAWYWTLPEEIRAHCHVHEKLQRHETLALMGQARVMLSPSLVDGVPNALYEAMACGTLPVISPLETIASVVEEIDNVLFARNLYPQEIADALVRAMNDDALVDTVAVRNLARVRELADRQVIRPKVVAFYEQLVKKQTPKA